jgi:hypothetical protein
MQRSGGGDDAGGSREAGVVAVPRATRLIGLLRPASLVGLAALALSPGLWLGPSLDAAVFVLAGVGIRQGNVPYRDLWDHKPPGSYLLNAAGQAALPWLDPWLVGWLLTLAFTGAAIVVFERLLRSRLSPAAAFLWSVLGLVLMASFPIALGGGLTESFAVLPLVVALMVIARAAAGLRAVALIGCLLSVACLLSLQALPAALALFAAATLRRGGLLSPVGRAAAGVAGGVVLPLAVVAWLAVRGAIGDALDQLVTYNAAYRSSAGKADDMIPVTLLLLLCLTVPAAIEMARMILKPRAFDRVGWACFAWAVGYLLYIGFQGRIYLHYLILLVPPAVWLAGAGTAWLAAQAKAPQRRVRAAAVGLLVAAWLAIAISAFTVVGLHTAFGRFSADRAEQLDTAAWIGTNTPSSATLFVWGHDADLYLLADRHPYDSYVYDFPLLTAGYAPDERLANLVADWTAAPPSVIVESLSEAPLLRAGEAGASTPGYPALGALRDFVRSHYRLASSSERYDIYVPRGE